MQKETILAPVSGIVAQILTSSGVLVKENELILQIECMKCYYDVSAGISGRINLIIQDGSFVQESEELGYIVEES